MPKQDGIGDTAPTLCFVCACVASSWHAHPTIWNCGVVNIGTDGYEMSAFCVKKVKRNRAAIDVENKNEKKKLNPGRTPPFGRLTCVSSIPERI